MKKFIFLVMLFGAQSVFGKIKTHSEFVDYVKNDNSSQQDFQQATHYLLSLITQKKYDEIADITKVLNENNNVFENELYKMPSLRTVGCRKMISYLMGIASFHYLVQSIIKNAYADGYAGGYKAALPKENNASEAPISPVENDMAFLGVACAFMGLVLHNIADVDMYKREQYVSKIAEIEHLLLLINHTSKNS